ncbi:MAG: NAD(P)/FAD-dependent oxidoreductase [Flavobacteriaceae bacterium]
MRADHDILIVGGGQAGRRAAQGARAANPDASIAILGEEAHPPYDRPELSKKILLGEDPAICFQMTPEAYAAARISLLPGQRARAIDPLRRTVATEDGDRYSYRRLVLATGSRPRKLKTPADPSILTLRSFEDAAGIAGQLVPGRHVAIIGAGFIGLEVAAAARARDCSVAIHEAGPRVMARTMPEAAARQVEAFHRAHGVVFHFGRDVGTIVARPDCIGFDANGIHHKADLVVIGIGIVPNIELAAEAGLAVEDGILADQQGRTSSEYVFVAGEVAAHPVLGRDAPARIESWHVAEYQAENAGRNAAGEAMAYRAAPWFWSDQYDHNIQSLGFVGSDDALIHRTYDDRACSHVAVDAEGRLKGIIAINAGKDIAAARRIIAAGQKLDPARLADPAVALKAAVAG